MKTDDYRESHLGQDKAKKYDDGFKDNPYRALMWELEREVLDRVVAALPATESLLDFATGTGRVLQYLEPRFSRSVGVDISADMLEIAASVTSSSELHEADLTASNILEGQRFDAIVAFRFFPNAQEELRDGSLQALAGLLAPSGRLIFNNHKNASSLVYRVAGLLSMKSKSAMSHTEVEAMLAKAGLEVESVTGLGIVPSIEKAVLLPKKVLHWLEGALGRSSRLQSVGVNQIYVAKLTATR